MDNIIKMISNRINKFDIDHPITPGVIPKVIFKQDQNIEYFNVPALKLNKWDNPYQTCNKIKKFYQETNERYIKSNPSDEEKIRTDTAIKNGIKKREQIAIRDAQQQQFKSRKTTRELLQFVSSQMLEKNADLELVQGLASYSPSVTTEFMMEQALSYKDPKKADPRSIPPKCSYPYQYFSKRQLKQLFQPNILRNDKSIFYNNEQMLVIRQLLK